MAEITQPSEIARETLRRLATQRKPPTPDNYRTLYHEIAGTRAGEEFPERSLKTLAGRLPRATPEQSRFGQQLDGAIVARDWAALTNALMGVMKALETEPLDWSDLIGDLLGQMERRHSSLTPAKKREAVGHILDSAGTDPANLYERMQSLLRSWSKTGAGSEPSPMPAGAASADDAPAPGRPADVIAQAAGPDEARLPGNDLRELIARHWLTVSGRCATRQRLPC